VGRRGWLHSEEVEGKAEGARVCHYVEARYRLVAMELVADGGDRRHTLFTILVPSS
jgi:hypothetical protein